MRPIPLMLCALVLASSATLATETRPLIGDPVNGKVVYEKSTKKKVRVNGNWINALTHKQSVKGLQKGKGGFPTIKSDNLLDRYDALAYIRSQNTNIRDIAGNATHILVTEGEYDKHAEERLMERAQLDLSGKKRKYRVFAHYTLGQTNRDLVLVRPKQLKKRDRLKPAKKSGYTVFMPLKGFRDGKHEVAFSVDQDILVTQIVIRAPDGSVPDDLNRRTSRLIGHGGRGLYDGLKMVGAGKAVRELKKPLSEAFLLGMEAVYMFEVDERDHFLFDE
jgi:hypothetical protein